MFGYFEDPFYEPYFGYRPVRIYHPFNVMNRYFNNLEHRLNSLFADAFEEELNNMIEDKSNKKDEQKEQKEEKPEENSEFKKDLKETQKKIEKKNENYKPLIYGRSYSSQRMYNGNEKFEEIREQTNDGEKTYITKIKRIGNRWVQIDDVIDKEGKKITKETWHNVGENEIDSFENEWSLRRGIQEIGGKNEKPAIKTEVKEEKKEEPKEEEKKDQQ